MTTHDPVKVAPKMYKVLLENHRVRVGETRSHRAYAFTSRMRRVLRG
jgi:hypothetical protein